MASPQESGSEKGPRQSEDVFYPEDAMDGRFSLVYDGGSVSKQTTHGGAVQAPSRAETSLQVYTPQKHTDQCFKELDAATGGNARSSVPGTPRDRSHETEPSSDTSRVQSPERAGQPGDNVEPESV